MLYENRKGKKKKKKRKEKSWIPNKVQFTMTTTKKSNSQSITLSILVTSAAAPTLGGQRRSRGIRAKGRGSSSVALRACPYVERELPCVGAPCSSAKHWRALGNSHAAGCVSLSVGKAEPTLCARTKASCLTPKGCNTRSFLCRPWEYSTLTIRT